MQVNIHEAKSQLSYLIQCVLNGEEVIIARNNLPVVRLESIAKPPSKRKLGSLRGLIKSMADDFDAPLNDFKDYMA
jgi:antitoxin (DNA-binding transcriptional repressor) of toxin-antitoxin stability system